MAERFDVVETYKYTRDGQEKTGWKRVGAAFSRQKGGFNIRIQGAVTIVQGINELVLLPPREQGATDFPPRAEEPMEGGAPTGEYPTDER